MLVPKLTVSEHRIQGCAPGLIQALTLFSYDRCVTVNRQLRHVMVETRRLWLWRRARVVSFARIGHIALGAQRLPPLFGRAETAVFYVSLVLKEPRDELRLFTVIERQPVTPDLLDALAGACAEDGRLGDEQGVRIATLLRDYLGVRIGR